MEPEKIIEFFDSRAAKWDEEMIKDDRIISLILDAAGVLPGKAVLDVACGTGVMIPYYLQREASRVDAVDISPAMAAAARAKFTDGRVNVLTADINVFEAAEPYDCIIIYNAFPHFSQPARLIGRLKGMLNPGGTLTVAHGMSKAAIDRIHRETAGGVSVELPEAEELSRLLLPELEITALVSNERMYLVTGKAE